MPKIATLTIINDEKLLPGVLSFIDSITAGLDFTRSKLLRFRIAYETMIYDRIINAYADTGNIDIDITLETNTLEVAVRDKGAPYWASAERYDPAEADSNARGLEEYLVANMCDNAGSEKLGRDGQRLYVRLYLPSPVDFTKSRRAQDTQRAPDDVTISIKEVTDDDKDIMSAITCIYDEYRYSYGYERLYYPENFKEIIRKGGLRSFLAVASNGDIAGHTCLSFSDDYPGLPEWATVVIRRPFRGRHLFDEFCKHAIGEAEQSGARALMTQPTAYHTATQKVAERHGFTATGLLFQYVYGDVESEYNKTGSRLDLAMAVKPLGQMRGLAYIPEEHSDFIKGIYRRLGAQYEFPEPHATGRDTQIKYEINSLMKSGRIVISSAGADFEKELVHTTGELRRNKVEMAEMLINISDPAAAAAFDMAKKYGYFFTGILPGGEKGDFLVMQNLFLAQIDTSVITTMGEYTEILQYLSESPGFPKA